VRKTVELCPHGGNGCVDSVDVVCCGTVCRASDNARYGALGVIARVTGEAKPVLSAVEALGLQPDGDGWSRRAASFRGMAVHRLQPVWSVNQALSHY